MIGLANIRSKLGLSQSKLARLAGVSRFKICTFELGGGSLTEQEQLQIRQALKLETARMRSIPLEMRDGEPH